MIDASEIKERLKCRDILDRNGIPYANRDICCPLPGHDDSTPSFGLFDDGKAFKCHGCGRGGDVIQLHRELTGQDFKQAVEDLGSAAGIVPSEPKAKKRIVATYDYNDENESLLFQVVRYEPKDFRQRRPAGNGEWNWKTADCRKVLYRLPELLKAKESQKTVYLVEGEKDVHTLENFGLVATTAPGGSGKWKPEFTETLKGVDVVLIPDQDGAGKTHCDLVTTKLHGIAKRLRVVDLPEKNGKRIKDVSEFASAGGTVYDLQEILDGVEDYSPPEIEKALPKVQVYDGGSVTIPTTAKQTAVALRNDGCFYTRSGGVVEVDESGIKPLKPQELVSILQPPLCSVVRVDKKQNEIPCFMPKSNCEILLSTRELKTGLPEIKHLSRCPVLIPGDGGLRTVEGYDEETGILVQGWDHGPIPEYDAQTAVDKLLALLADFDFPSESERSRAVALLLTPALIGGGLLGENARAPVGLVEADQSQTGKGFFCRITSELYAEKIRTITQRKGGVGSIEESFSSAISSGANVVLFDNLRGALDSQLLESVTTEPMFDCRIPYRGTETLDVRKLFVLLTSNKAELTKDLSNRCCAVRLRKRAPGFKFRKYAEGDLLTHLQKNRAEYLGAVHSVIRAWWDAGRQSTDETRHSFRPWVQALDWVVQNIFDLPPLLDGHEETQARVADPSLQWLRDVALQVVESGLADRSLKTQDLVDLCRENEIELPSSDGSGTGEENTRVLQAVGRRMAKWFRDDEPMKIDGVTITRERHHSPEHGDYVNLYRFTQKPAIPPIPPEDPNIFYREQKKEHSIQNVGTISGYSGYRGKSAQTDTEIDERRVQDEIAELQELF